jgi:undecaprenyl-phosphate 4-deoxy-4-formamido-L-arabinose transferase
MTPLIFPIHDTAQAADSSVELVPGISICVPVYRSRETLVPLIEEIARVLPTICESFEVLLVEDGCPDQSWEVIEQIAARYPWVRGIRMLRNYGQHNALLCAIRAARCETIVTMDDDLQHPPQEIPKLLAKLGEGHDVVYGTPQELPHSWWRNLTSRMTKHAFSLATGNRNIKDISAFRAFRTKLRMAFADFRAPQLQIDVLLSWATRKFTTTTVRHEARKVGASNYTFTKLVNHTMLLLTGYSTAPLRLASFVGFMFTILGGLILCYAVGRYLVGESIPGFPFLAATIAIFSGIQLFILGIIGEYLARMFNRSLDRPTYVAQDLIGGHEMGQGVDSSKQAA